MNEIFQKKYIFYGIVLLFLTNLLKSIINSMTSFIIGYFNFNILLIPIISIIFCTLIIIIFFKIKIFPKLYLWLFLLIIILFICSNFFLTDIYIEQYTPAERGMNYSIMKGIDFLFMLTFSIVAYIKYNRIKEKSN